MWPGCNSLWWEALVIFTHDPVEVIGHEDNEDSNGDYGISLRFIVNGWKRNDVDSICDHKKADDASFNRESPNHVPDTC